MRTIIELKTIADINGNSRSVYMVIECGVISYYEPYFNGTACIPHYSNEGIAETLSITLKEFKRFKKMSNLQERN